MRLKSINPENYQTIGEVEISTLQEVQAKVAAAHRAKKGWQGLGVEGRVALLKKVVREFERDKEALARLINQEMGKKYAEALSEMEFGIDYYNSYFEHAAEYLKPELTGRIENEVHEVHHEPYGVAAVIVAWNYPFSNFVWQTGQNLIAGNTVVFKHSEETPLFGKALEERIVKFLPAGVFSEVYGDGSVGEMLINQDVNLICFTGSSQKGLQINQIAASRMIKTVMELGGSAPGIVFEDADIEAIVPAIIAKRFSNNGQMCDALKRLIVHESQVEKVTEKLRAHLTSFKPIPLVAKRQVDLIKAQVEDGVAKGAKILIGGKAPKSTGAFFEPTLVTGVTRDMRLWKEEVFGPVLPIVTFKEEAEAIQLANDTKYGLGATIFTQDQELFKRVSEQVESGMVCQNSLSYVHPFNPFGGYKLSGNAREHSKFGFHEVTQVKVVSMEAVS